jgi:hypothetical protein
MNAHTFAKRPPSPATDLWILMKAHPVLVASLVIFCSLAPARADSVVYPTGTFPADFLNVRAAVNAGGTVLLKATDVNGTARAFNFDRFGQAGPTVDVDVTVLGETVAAGRTTIVGGFLPLRNFRRVRFVVRGIHFEGPMSAAVFVGAGTHIEITGNHITNVVGNMFDPNFKGQGIWATGEIGLIAGPFIVSDNVVEHVDANLGYGIALFGLSSDIRIANNTFIGGNTSGILVGVNTGPAWIENNVVVPGPELYPGHSAGNGITAAGNGFGGPFYIRRNVIDCENPLADGIFVAFETNDSVVEQNRVTMRNSVYGAITLFDSVSNTYVGRNQIEGSGSWALNVQSFHLPELPNAANTFQANNISGFTATLHDVFFAASAYRNVLIGDGGTVLDLGTDNWITGFAKGPGGNVGARVSEAQARKHEFLRSLAQSLPPGASE